MRKFFRIVPFCVLAAGLLAQDAPLGMPPSSKTPDPYPPGTHDSRKYPPLPGTKRPGKAKKDEDLVKASGEVREMATDHLVVETKDHRVITFHLTKDTKFLDGDTTVALKDISLGQLLDVEAQEDSEEEYFAVTVHLKAQPATVVKAAEPDPDEEARPKLKFGKPETTEVRAEASDPDAEARPKLKSGKPEPRPAPAETETARPEEPAAAPLAGEPKPDPHVEFLEKARELAFTFTDGLPNYMCLEVVTRYFSETHAGTLWKPQDVVSEEVIWNNNKEEYRNVQIDGKKVNPEKVGDRAWSTGEFGTVLADLLHPATQAHFKFVRTATLHRTDTLMYDFSVEQSHSHWTVHEGGQSIRPAYSGTIWFDKATGHTLRIEYSADDLPKEFPADTAELTLDYDYVQLGQKRFLLPVHSEVLMCHRGMSACAKNAIDFRNYHKYGAESDIKFADEQMAPPLAPSAQPKPKH
ncbi:MAG: hypothetical protein ABSH47_10730 [Bryobacteraceae bacterium]